MLRFFFIIFVNLTVVNYAQAVVIIRDAEIEETINLVIKPLKKCAKLPNLKIHLIKDNIPNAFTTGGNDIFIHSGLITKFPDPDVLRGVIAHEIGHIKGNHIIRRSEIIENYKKALIGSTILGLATSIVTANPLGAAIILGSEHVAGRSISGYSRNFESNADQVALKLLDDTKHSSIGMIKFFEKMQIFSKDELINPYDSTHPLSNERLAIIRKHNKNSKYRLSQNKEELNYLYARSAAKLAAFTLEIKKLDNYKYVTHSDELSLYVKTIKNFRIGKFSEAIKTVDELIKQKPEDAYYHELKGQIYFEFGKDGAIKEYKLAKKYKPDSLLIRLGLGIAGINKYQVSNPKMQFFVKELEYFLKKDPDNLTALYYMAIYYRRKGQEGKSYLNTALISLKSGRKNEARKMARLAMSILPKNTSDWYKAGDILVATE